MIGLRPVSLRFEAGVYVRLPAVEVERCRRLLGLAAPRAAPVGRRANRVPCDLVGRFADPRIPGTLRVRNLSLTGALMTGRIPIPRIPMNLEITLDDNTALVLPTRTSWLGNGAFTGGVLFGELTAPQQEALQGALARLQAAMAARPGPRRVVIADDDHAILHMLDTVLSRHGYDTYRASDGDEACDLIRDLNPSLVLLDLLMPGVDGADVCRMMRADVELARVPVIFLSAMEERKLVEICQQCGASDYLIKPLALADLLNLVGRYLAMLPPQPV